MNREPSPSLSVGTSLNRVMLAVVGIALILTLGLGYQSVVRVFEQESVRSLRALVSSRAEGESQRFASAERSVRQLKVELLKRFDQIDGAEAEQAFYQRFSRSGDGLWRVRPEYDDYEALPSLYLQHDAPLSDSLYTRAMASYQLLAERGPALVPPYYSIYMDFVERGLMVFSPHVDWGSNASRKSNNFNYPTMSGAAPKNNPQRSQFWTRVYFDREAQTWMVSVIEPLDWQGEWVGTVGHDLSVQELVQKTLQTGLDGEYEMIFSSDGSLIAHPGFSQQIKNSKRDLALDRLDDPSVKRVYNLLMSLTDYPAVVEDPEGDYFYGVSRVDGPGWLLVKVYPTDLVNARARDALYLPAIAGVLLILSALFLLRGVIQRMVLRPLEYLDSAAHDLVVGASDSRIPITENNEFGRLARTFEEMSAQLKERERSLLEARNDWQRTFSSVLELIVIVNPDMTVKQANQSFHDNYGLTEAEVLGRNRFSLMTEGTALTFKKQYEIAVEEKSVRYFSAYSDRLGISFEITLLPLVDDKDQLSGFVEVSRDVTERRRLEDQLRQSQKMDAIGQLAGGVAHDFNNLLQVILGYAESLEADVKREDGDVSPAERILAAGNKAAALTQQLLAFGRRQMLQSVSVDINSVIFAATNMVGRLIESNIQMTFTPSPEPLIVSADANQIDQVLINLCVNARDAMEQGGTLDISVQQVAGNELPEELAPHETGYARISVEDSGCGIDPQLLENIFEPFFTTKEKHKGTGLGLATAYGIVQQHQGTITVTSKLNEGSRFCVYLPLLDEPAQTLLPEVSGDPGSSGSECILLADDDDTILGLLVHMLENAGYKVLTATDGAEALSVYRQHAAEIDMLVLDMMMPEVSGHGVIREIREDNPDLPCLLASGYSDQNQRENLEVNAITAFITKPFRREALLRAVRALLEGETAGKIDQT